jgi:hypothetical protein
MRVHPHLGSTGEEVKTMSDERLPELDVPPGASLRELDERVSRLERAPVHFELDGVRGEDGSLEIRGVSLCPGADPDRPVFVVVARDRLEEMSAANILELMSLAGNDRTMVEVADEVARRHAFVVREYYATNQQLVGRVVELERERDERDRLEGFPTGAESPFDRRAADRLAAAADWMIATGGLDARSPVGDARIDYGEPFDREVARRMFFDCEPAPRRPDRIAELEREVATLREVGSLEDRAVSELGDRVEEVSAEVDRQRAELDDARAVTATLADLERETLASLRPRWTRVEELVASARETLGNLAADLRPKSSRLDSARSTLDEVATLLAPPPPDGA